MAGGNNKVLFVRPGHIFGWNLMKLGMGPLFDMLYREKWSNSVRRTVRPAKPAICPAIFFHVFFTFWIIWKFFFQLKNKVLYYKYNLFSIPRWE